MSKSWVIVLGIAVGFFPWLSGGKDPLAILVTYFGLVIAGLLLLRREGIVSRTGPAVRLFATLLIIWSGLSLTWSVNRFQTELWVVYLVAGVAAWYLTRMLDDHEKQNLLNVYLVVAAVMGVYGLYAFETADYNRLTGSFYWANPAAAYIIPAIVLSVWRYIRTNAFRYAALSTFFILIFSLTYSRGATIVLGLIYIIALLLSKRLRGYWIKILFILAAAFLLSSLCTAVRNNLFHHGIINAASRYSEAAKGESTSVGDRLRYLRDAADIWVHNPLQGTGAGTFGTVHPQHQSRVISATSNAHNVYIQTLAELGLVGFSLLILLILGVMAGLIKGVYHDSARLPILIAVLGLLMHFGLDIDNRYPALIALLAVLMAVGYRTDKPHSSPAYRAAALPALVLVCLGLVTSYYQSTSWAARATNSNLERDFTSAAKQYGQAHTGWMYEPDYWTAEGIDYYTLAAITSGSKSYAKLAIDRANNAIARDPRDGQHYLLRARTERLGGDYVSAERDYRQALALDRYNHPEYYGDLAELKLLQGDEGAAWRVAKDAIKLYSDDVLGNRSADPEVPRAVSQIYVVLALHELSQGRQGAGQAYVKKAIKVDPRNPVARKLQKGTYEIRQLIRP